MSEIKNAALDEQAVSSETTNETVDAKLLKKMQAEQETYRNWLLTLQPEEILDHAFEYTTREDIIGTMDLRIEDLSEQQVSALLTLPDPLNTIYKKLHDLDGVIQVAAEEANRIIMKGWLEDLPECDVPVYYQNFVYASEHGELDAYRASWDANWAFVKAIEELVDMNYNGYSLCAERLGDIVAKFSVERAAQVFASIINAQNYDGRYSRRNKDWASATAKFAEEIRATVHPGLINLLVDTFRMRNDI